MSDVKLVDILKKDKNFGFSITDLVNKTRLSRSAVRILLAKLEGAGKVEVRRVGMAKLYFLKRRRN